MRLLMLCVDALGADWLEHCFLPDMPGAAWGELYSERAYTGPGWTSVLTGLTVAEHGVTSPVGTAHEGSKTFADLAGRYLWDVLPGPCGMLSVPTTFPPRGRPGDWMVAGFPFRPACYPRGLLDGIDYISDYAKIAVQAVKRRDGNTYWPSLAAWDCSITMLGIITELRIAALAQLPAVEYLFVGLTYVDRVGHLLQGSSGAPKGAAAYEALDCAAAYIADVCQRLIERYPAALTVLASDHGLTEAGAHDPRGAWAIWGAGVTAGRHDLKCHQLRQVIEARLSETDPEILARMRALGYMADA